MKMNKLVLVLGLIFATNAYAEDGIIAEVEGLKKEIEELKRKMLTPQNLCYCVNYAQQNYKCAKFGQATARFKVTSDPAEIKLDTCKNLGIE